MASRKKLKQYINSTAGELFSECLFCRLYIPGTKSEKTDATLAKILEMQDEFLNRLNHPGGKNNKSIIKAYYKKLKTDLSDKINEIIQDIRELDK